MQWINMALAAMLTGILFYLLQYRLDKSYSLHLKYRGKWILDPIVVFTGIITFVGTAVIAAVRFPEMGNIQCVSVMILLCGMAVLTVTDTKITLIPNRILMILFLLWTGVTGLAMIENISSGFELLCRSLGGGLISGIIFLLCYIISKGQMGAGDVKLAFVMGLFLTGDRIIGAIFYGTLLCGVYSLVQILQKKLTLKNGVPMTPFLYAGTLITLVLR